jgi:uncharacterized lipoprotein NlpE involved in copper resistance
VTNIFDEHLPPIKPLTEEEKKLRGYATDSRTNKRREVALPSANEIKKGAVKLAELASRAFETLEEAMDNAEWPVAVQAAKMVLDRAGYGSTSTLNLNDNTDLTNLSDNDLATVALLLAKRLNPAVDNKSESNESESGSVH